MRSPSSFSFQTAVRAVARTVRRTTVILKFDRPLAKAGRYFSSNPACAKLLPTHESFRPNDVRLLRRSGISLRLTPADYTHWLAYFGIEESQRRALRALVREGDFVLDVGTNLGEVLLQLAQAVGPGGRVIGFEPNPQTFLIAEENLALNDWAKAEVHQLGLGDRAETLNLGSRADTNSGADCVIRGETCGHSIRVLPLDQFAGEHDIKRVDLIKVDVEGFEMHVLRGGEKTIEQFRPILFLELCEDNLRRQGESAAGVLRWLEDREYGSVDAMTGAPVTSADDLAGCFLDVIARHNTASARSRRP